ncbi:MAG: class I SAM-dependent methyltransferase [bacterium]|nr:class I SAM-dependent methyltransferase [bacterium]
MATAAEHYENVLSDVYSWMLGGFESGVQRNIDFFDKHSIDPVGSKLAIDLGAGCGFQSIPLAMRNFSVIAIDIDAKLLKELNENKSTHKITTVQDDLYEFDKYAQGKAELVICMTDTLLHLESKSKVESLFLKVFSSLEDNGKFILTYRDLSFELSDIDRFIPVKSDDNIILLCFLEYESETVKVHDIVYFNENGEWNINKSFYRKLRLSKDWIDEKLLESGFTNIDSKVENGLITVIAAK